jgi:proton-dependent oligopeptide transporter, POT family
VPEETPVATPATPGERDAQGFTTRQTWFERVFKHPQGLAVLFLTEMWERFSFYGMRGLLKGYMVYYLFVDLRQKLYVPEDVLGAAVPTTVGHPYDVIGWHTLQKILLSVDPTMDAQGQASMVYGLYNGLVYLTPVLGGLLADRFFGQRRIVVFGALVMAAGQFLMSSDSLFFVALLVLILGNGAFKPNISTQVGNLYPDGDPRRDRAYSIFYVGINLGSFICNFICGTLAAVYGWHYGFMAAGVGLLIGLAIYLYGQRHLAPDNKMRSATAPERDKHEQNARNVRNARKTLSRCRCRHLQRWRRN